MKKAAILVISDSVAQGKREDSGGRFIKRYLEDRGYEPELAFCADEAADIVGFLQRWIKEKVPLILTTGGTGITPRDITPEATRQVIEKELVGMEVLLYLEGLRKTKRAVLSRGVIGVADQSFIVNLPGSPKALADYMPVVLELYPHIYDLLHGKTEHHYEKE